MTTDTTPKPSSDLTAGDMLMTLNGFDEIAIAARFGVKLAELRTEGEAITLGRALIFTDYRRQGEKDGPAYVAAMDLSMTDVMHYFTPEKKAKKKAAKKKSPRDAGTPPADVPGEDDSSGKD